MSESGLSATTPSVSEGQDRHPAEQIADFLEEHGWIQGALHTDKGYCISGAGQILFGHNGWWYGRYREVLNRLGRQDPMMGGRSISDFNDRKGRTKEEVLKALRGQNG